MKKRNTPTIGDNKQAKDLIRDGLIKAVNGEGDALAGDMEVAAGLVRIRDSMSTKVKQVSTQKLTAHLQKLVSDAEAEGKLPKKKGGEQEFRAEHGNRLLGSSGDKASLTAASGYRTALMWMIDQPAQLEWVETHTKAMTSIARHSAWKKEMLAQVVKAVEEGKSDAQIKKAITGKNDDALTKAIKAARKAKPKPKPVQEPPTEWSDPAYWEHDLFDLQEVLPERAEAMTDEQVREVCDENGAVCLFIDFTDIESLIQERWEKLEEGK